MRLIAIDPGKFAGWAYFEDDTVRELGLVCEHRQRDALSQFEQFRNIGAALNPTHVIYEASVIYPDSEKRDADQIATAGLGGRLAGVCAGASNVQPACAVAWYEPRQWKGTIPKEVHNDRTRALCPQAVGLMPHIFAGQQNHVWDAVGLALRTLKGRWPAPPRFRP